jgi:hypothetical protein
MVATRGKSVNTTTLADAEMKGAEVVKKCVRKA